MKTVQNVQARTSFWILALIVGFVCSLSPLALAADETDSGGGMQVTMKFGTGIDPETRTLLGEADVFPAGSDKVFCFTRISGAEAPTTLTHAWYFKGKTKARVDLNIGAASWRTWSSKNIMDHWVGPWEVKVLDDAGQVLATGNFEIK